MVEDTSRGGQDDDTETTGGEQQVDPRFDLVDLYVEAGGDDTGLVQAAVELDDDLAGAVVVDLLKLANVAVALHDAQELDDDLGARADEHLALSATLGIDNIVEAVVQDRYADHFS
ncbi:hypothetical protein LNV47_24875 [Paucibacter sp. DJ4R-1]|nr:hypothetical protein [Paucibacter sp. DJ4R-1]